MGRTYLLLLLLSSLLTGCAGTATTAAPPPALFADTAFRPPSETIGTRDLFTLSPEMRTYLHSSAFAAQVRMKGPRQGLVDALYSKSDLRLEYDSRRTRTAAETYAARSGNCLSLVIMTAAFARELGMKVRFQSVSVDDTWSRGGGLYVLSSHVNIALGKRSTPGIYDGDTERALVVDFLPPPEASRLRTRELDDMEIEALYLNNRAVETLVEGDVDGAYWWARAAVQANPRDATSYNTLGVIYLRHGDMAFAEHAYRAALEREPENIAVLRNLGPLLATLGRADEARDIERRLASIDPVPPFHYFDKGMTALEKGDYEGARKLFEREVKRAPYSDEFHFWLAIALLRLNEPQEAREHLVLAVQNSVRGDTRELYSAKLAQLRRKNLNSMQFQ
jgi:Tfp pilus assembly protein PilF